MQLQQSWGGGLLLFAALGRHRPASTRRGSAYPPPSPPSSAAVAVAEQTLSRWHLEACPRASLEQPWGHAISRTPCSILTRHPARHTASELNPQPHPSGSGDRTGLARGREEDAGSATPAPPRCARLLPGVTGSHLTDPSPDGGARGRGWGVNPKAKPVGPLMSAGRARGRPRCPAQTGAGAPGSPGCGLDPTALKPCGGLGAEFGRRGRRADSEPALRGAQLPPAGPRSSALRSSTARHVFVCLVA